MILFALAFLLVGQVARVLFAAGQTYPAVILAPNGIVLAALILHGGKHWKYLWLAAFLNALLNNIPFFGAFIAALLYILQGAIGAAAFHLFKLDERLWRLRDTIGFCAIAITTSSILPAGGIMLIPLVSPDNQVSFAYWWLGHVISALVLTPLLIRGLSKQRAMPMPAQRTEIVIAFSLLILTDFFFWTKYPPEATLPFVLLQLGLFLWIALRMGMTYMSWASFISSVIFLTAPFYGFDRPEAGMMSERIASTEVYMAIFAILFYLLASVFEERNMAFASLRANIEELERTNEKIRQDDLKKSEFIAVLAHELRNPLVPITNHLQLMELNGIAETNFRPQTDGIKKQIRNITRLLEDLLDISRITQGKIDLKRERTDLRESIFHAAEAVQSFINSRNQTLAIKADTPVWTCGDPLRLEQIIVNLLNNAAKYTNPGGHIDLICETDATHAILIVRDNGIGICPEILPRIFDPFIQADNSITRTYGGLGIGLKLVKSLTEMHEGTVTAESEGLGKGSCFTVRLPLLETDNATERLLPLSVLTQVGLSRKILVVDDNQDVVQSLTELLKLLGHEVVSAFHGDQAVDVARTHKPSLVLLDIGLPGKSGYEVARLLRADLGQTATLIAVSGYGQEEDKLRSKEAGFDHHLTKPVNITDIQNALKLAG